MTRPAQLAPPQEFDSIADWQAYVRAEHEKVEQRTYRKNLILGCLFIASILAIPSVVAYLIYIRVVH